MTFRKILSQLLATAVGKGQAKYTFSGPHELEVEVACSGMDNDRTWFLEVTSSASFRTGKLLQKELLKKYNISSDYIWYVLCYEYMTHGFDPFCIMDAVEIKVDSTEQMVKWKVGNLKDEAIFLSEFVGPAPLSTG